MSYASGYDPKAGIAIIGIAGRFPGAKSADELWRNLVAGVDSVSRGDDLIRLDDVAPELRADPHFVRAAGVIEGEDQFDPSFFGMTVREAELMDPQHRILLQTAWEALEDAGYAPQSQKSVIGVFASTGPNGYLGSVIAPQAQLLPAGSRQLVMFGNEKDFLATRISYRLNLRGPSMAVQTACSSSLVAVCEAVASLESYQCDMALAGGVAIPVPLRTGSVWHEGSVLSPDGYCRAFDAAANGTSPGSGAGIVALKRLADAIADGDAIYAVIKGFALNNDGSERVSFAAPSVEGQTHVIASAQALAGTDPDTITYIETHGTGTSLGDPIEIEALTRAFRLGTEATAFCAIGSLKTNVGHMDTAAGVGGLIKAALALRHGQIPPSLHYDRPNANIDFATTPFYVNTRLQEWRRGALPRRAGVSSFGMGGTNAHLVLEEAPDAAPRPSDSTPQVLLISARTETARDAAVARLATHLQQHAELALADVAHTLRVGRERFEHFATVVASDTADAARALADPQRVRRGSASARAASVAFLFPGQGAQTARMAQQFYETDATFRRIVDECCDVTTPLLGVDLRTLMYPAAGAEADASARLAETRITQPALFIVEYALAEVLRTWGVTPAAMIGHSLGEFVAACIAGTFSLADALRVVCRRADLMQQAERGAMLALRMSEADVRRALPNVLSVAACNAPSLTVVSGPLDAIEAFANELRGKGIESKRLNTSHAFHSSMMDSVLAPFRAFMGSIAMQAPSAPWVSSVTGTWIAADEATDPEYWTRQIRQPVRFTDGVRTLLAEPDRVFVEVGPGRTLSTLVAAHERSERQFTEAVLPSASVAGDAVPGLLHALGHLWFAGVGVDRTAHQRFAPHRVHLPAYPFETRRIWLELADVSSAAPLQFGTAATVTESQAAPSEPGDAADSLVTRLRALFASIAGAPPDRISTTAQFVEIGFDSLLLTQLSGEVKRQFGVTVSFRDLLERFSSIEALAEHIGSVAPAEHLASKPTRASRDAATLSGSQSAAPKPEQEAHGPYRPIQRGAHQDLSEKQRNALRDLEQRWTRKTAASKRMVQQHRGRLADPRTAAGFRSAWKEIVYPIVTDRSAGSRIWDVDGNEYIDFVSGFGAILLGHSPAYVTDALERQVRSGFEIGPQSSIAGEVAERIGRMAGMERVAFCNTGSEAVTAAFRVARTVTMRDRIVMFAGSYHGVFDEVTMRPPAAGSDLRSIPVAPGIMSAAGENIVILRYGEPDALEYIRAHVDEIAAVIVEPVQSRRLDLQPREFLHELRRITADGGAALIFDEIITGFRVHQRGAQAFFGVQPDIGTYGKVVAGGLPLGVVAGTRRFMDALDGGFWQFGDESAPEVGVTFFAGTFVRHPLALAASLAVLQHLESEGPALQRELNLRTRRMVDRLNACAVAANAPMRVTHFGSVFAFHQTADTPFAGLFAPLMRDKGIYVRDAGPSFVSTAHTDADVDRIVGAFSETLAEMLDAGFIALRPAAEVPAPAQDVQLPLTEAQREVWLATEMTPGASAAFNICLASRFHGDFSVDAMQRAIDALFARHEALRVTFNPHGETQRVRPPVPVDLRYVDLSARSQADREAEVRRLLDAETRDPLVLSEQVARVRVIRESRTSHVTVLTVHHIVCDGYSTSVLVGDFQRLLEAENAGLSAPLQRASSYVDFVRRQTGAAHLETIAADESYWLTQLAGTLPVLELPNDLPRPAARTSSAGRVTAPISATLHRSLRTAGGRYGATMFSTLLAAFQAFLARVTGQSDLIVGIPVATQAESGERELVTHATNLLPLRTSVQHERAFSEHLRASAQQLLDAKAHQAVTFGSLIRSVNVPRNPSRPPLVAVTFNVDRVGRVRDNHGKIEAIPLVRQSVNFEIDVNVVDTGDEATVQWTYNSDLFSAGLIHGFAECFTTMLEAVAEDPMLPLERIPILPRQQAEALDRWNETSRSIPTALVHEMISAQAARTPDRVAVSTGDTHTTYRELETRANQIAHALRSRGARRGTLVAVCLERSAELVASLLGVLKSGAAYVPLDPSHPPARLKLMLDDAAVSVVLTEEWQRFTLPETSALVMTIDGESKTISTQPLTSPSVAVTPGDRAYVIYTSGSTGRPKGVAISHGGLVNVLDSMRARPGLHPGDVFAAVTTVSFDIAGLELFLPLIAGARLELIARDESVDGIALAARLAATGATVMQATPASWSMLIDAGWKGGSEFRAWTGGEALSSTLAASLLDRTKEVWNLYGPTETTIWSTLDRVTTPAPITVGTPIANTRVHVVDALGQRVPLGVVGELVIAGAGVAEGYHGRPDLTAERFMQDPFGPPGARAYRTGDLARWRTDGRLEHRGRTDSQVKIRGYRVELGEIESVLVQQPGVREAVAVVRPGRSGDPAIVAYITTAGWNSSVESLRESLRTRLPRYMIPATIVEVDRFPLSPNGKVDTRALPSPDVDASASSRVYVEPRTEVETRLAAQWCTLLGVERVGVNDDFFELGGHSIMATRIAVWIREEFNVEFPVYAIFEGPTVSALAARLERSRREKMRAAAPREEMEL